MLTDSEITSVFQLMELETSEKREYFNFSSYSEPDHYSVLVRTTSSALIDPKAREVLIHADLDGYSD